jgi:hypothetical protein
LQEALLSAPVAHISKIDALTSDAKAVCVLQPYQDRLHILGDIAASVNAHLAKVKFSSDEGHFTFVFARNHGIEIERIKRSQDLDFFSNRQMPAAISNALPHNFSQEDCVTGSSAAVIKVKFHERSFIIFGQILKD